MPAIACLVVIIGYRAERIGTTLTDRE